MREKRNELVFFYCCPTGAPEDTPYHHNLVCIAEGLQELGIPFVASNNYWRVSASKYEYLFAKSKKYPLDKSLLVLVDSYWIDNLGSFPEDFFASSKEAKKIFFDVSDGTRTSCFKPEMSKFDYIFKLHYNQRISYPKNVYPWAFGISNRFLVQEYVPKQFSDRKKSILVNFRVKHPVRQKSLESFLPCIENILTVDDSVESFHIPTESTMDYLHWVQTGRRHYPQYYDRLTGIAACACFGGYFVSPIPANLPRLMIPLGKLVNFAWRKLNLYPKQVLQWDSWRFWESLAAGCVTFHVDFEKYGIRLPVMPQNWKHYIGVDLDNPSDTIKKIVKEPHILEEVAVQGRRWALQNYSPVATAQRLLEVTTRNTVS